MIKISLIDDDMFLDMSRGARLLYFDLNMRADDDGFITPNKVMRMTGATPEDLQELKDRQFVIPFESGVMVIRHWKMHNYLRKDTHHGTQYEREYQQLEIQKSGLYKLRSETDNEPSTNRPRAVDVDKTRQDKTKTSIDKTRLDQEKQPGLSVSQSADPDAALRELVDRAPTIESILQKQFPEGQAPTLPEVLERFKDRNPETVRKAFDYYQGNGWKDGTGKPLKDWQKVLAAFIDNERSDRQTRQTRPKKNSFNAFTGREYSEDERQEIEHAMMDNF